MIINDVEAVRIQSQLSERLHYVESDGKKYMCFSGITLPYNIGVSFLIWGMSNTDPYRVSWSVEMINEIRELNPIDISNQITTGFLIRKFRTYLRTSENQLDEIIPIDAFTII